jgi:hypothetical protein
MGCQLREHAAERHYQRPQPKMCFLNATFLRLASRLRASSCEVVPGQPVDATPAVFKCFLQKDVFSDLWERYSTYSHVESDLMRCFESRALVREIGCALGKARNVFHLKEVLH